MWVVIAVFIAVIAIVWALWTIGALIAAALEICCVESFVLMVIVGSLAVVGLFADALQGNRILISRLS